MPPMSPRMAQIFAPHTDNVGTSVHSTGNNKAKLTIGLIFFFFYCLSPVSASCPDFCVCSGDMIICQGVPLLELPSFQNFKQVQIYDIYSEGPYYCGKIIGVHDGQIWTVDSLDWGLCLDVVDCLESWGAQIHPSSCDGALELPTTSPSPPPTIRPATHSVTPAPSTMGSNDGMGSSSKATIAVVSVVIVLSLIIAGYKLAVHLRQNNGGATQPTPDVRFFSNPAYNPTYGQTDGIGNSVLRDGAMDDPSTELKVGPFNLLTESQLLDESQEETEQTTAQTVQTLKQEGGPLTSTPVRTDDIGDSVLTEPTLIETPIEHLISPPATNGGGSSSIDTGGHLGSGAGRNDTGGHLESGAGRNDTDTMRGGASTRRGALRGRGGGHVNTDGIGSSVQSNAATPKSSREQIVTRSVDRQKRDGGGGGQ